MPATPVTRRTLLIAGLLLALVLIATAVFASAQVAGPLCNDHRDLRLGDAGYVDPSAPGVDPDFARFVNTDAGPCIARSDAPFPFLRSGAAKLWWLAAAIVILATALGLAVGKSKRLDLSWQQLLFLGVATAVVLAAVGVVLDGAAAPYSDAHVGPGADNDWPHPFARDLTRGSSGQVIEHGDQRYWFFASAAVLLLVLAAVPLVRERARRRTPTPG